MRLFERTSQRVLVDIAAIVVIVAGMRAAAPIITQFLIIAFLVIIFSPLYYWMVKRRVPSWLALLLLVVMLIVVVAAGIALLAQSVIQLAKNIPSYQHEARAGIEAASAWLAQIGIEIPPTLFDDIFYGPGMRSSMGTLWKTAQGFFGNGFIIILITAFCLYELPRLPKLRNSRWMTEEVWAKLVYVTGDVRHYMGIKTVISLATGIFIYLGLWALGVDSPLLLGMMAFLLNYVPVVGSAIAAIPGVLLALTKLGMQRGILVIVLYAVVNQVFGGIIEPKLMGKGFGVSPVVILVSMLFWGFVLGPIGMMLSVPLTMGLRVVLGSLHELASDAKPEE